MVGNVVAAVIGVILFLCGMALIGLSFANPEPLQAIMFIGGILVIAIAIGVPRWVLDKIDG